MSIDGKKRTYFGLVIFVSIVSAVLIGASLATQYWVTSTPIRLTLLAEDRYSGEIHFGLFHGWKELDKGIHQREPVEMWIVCSSKHGFCGWSDKVSPDDRRSDVDNAFSNSSTLRVQHYQENKTVFTVIENQGMFHFGLWVATIVLAALGIVWGLVSIVFAFVNVSTRPIYTITGPIGLYIWNSVASFFTLLSVVMFTVLYLTQLTDNILDTDDLSNKWSSKGRSNLGVSYWLLVGAVFGYLLNIVFILLSGVRCHCNTSKSSMNNMDGVMMY